MSVDQPALEGTLDDVPLGSLLRMLGSQGRSGNIQLLGSTPAVVRLHAGKIDFATGSDLSPLRRSLDSVVDDAEWDSITKGAVTPQDAVERIVRASGLGVASVREALREQTAMTLFEFAVPGDDRFLFHDHPEDQVHTFGEGFEIEEMLHQVDRRVAAWREIATTVPSTSTIFRLTSELPVGISEVRLGGADWKILAAADGYRSVGQMVNLLGADAFAVCSAVHRLCQADLLERQDLPAAKS